MTWLENARLRRAMTYEELARRSRLSRSQVWGIAVKGLDCRLSSIKRLAAALDMSLTELLNPYDIIEGPEEWAFDVWCQEYGAETFGPFVTRRMAEHAIVKAKFQVATVGLNPHRAYTEPYRVK